MDQKLEKWIKWIGQIKRDVVDLSTVRQVHAEFAKIVMNNPIVNLDNLFFWYINRTYYSTLLSGIRRHDQDKDYSASLVNLLQEIVENPKVYCKKAYDRPQDANYNECGLLDAPQNKYSDTTGEYLNIDLVSIDLAEIKQKIKSCCDYVDRRIAHLDSRPMDNIKTPNEKEVDECVNLINQLFHKYNCLLTRTDTDTIVHDSSNWQKLFRMPWIVEKQGSPA
jgi:hypothetical protein